jgi:two-component system response regulator VanR
VRSSKTIKVLLVDDCKHVREMIELALSSTVKQGITFLYAENVKDAIEILKSNDVHLVISELHLPRGHGFDLLEEKLRSGITSPIIIFSSSTRNMNKILLSRGADAFFSKSQGIEELMNLVSEYLNDLGS